MKIKKVFNILRSIAIASIVCTFITTVFMLVQAALPSQESGKVSGALSGSRTDEIIVEDNQVEIQTKKILLKVQNKYVGEKLKPTLTYIPSESTDKGVKYTLNNNDVAFLDNDGYLNFTKPGYAKIVATLVSNPNITASYEFCCLGQHPSKITNLKLENNVFKIGKIDNITLLDQNNEQVFLNDMNISYENNDNFEIVNEKIIPKKISSSTFSISHDKMAQTFNFKITIDENPNYHPLNEILLNKNVLSDDNVYNIQPNTIFDFHNLIIYDSSNENAFNVEIINPNNNVILSKENTNLYKANKVGSCELKISSIFNKDITKTIKINVFVPKPSKISIYTENIIVVDALYHLKVFGDDNYIDNVTYEIIKGIAILDKSYFRPKWLGKLVIKATYNDDSNLSTTITLNVRLYGTFGQFVRKVIGHFLLFTVLGIGFYCVYLFLIKKRWLAIPLSIITGFILACTSEALQLTADGRFASWTDVFVDFFGFFGGVIVTLIIFALVFLITKLTKKYETIKYCFDSLSYKTIFKPTNSVLKDINN